nr:DUF1648 domain-containing protein [Alteribacter salitolerans]
MEKRVDVGSLLVLAFTVVYVIVMWKALPDTIPIHFNLQGESDGWGSPGTLFILPLITAGLWLGMTVLEKYPHTFNYLHLTRENMRFQYENMLMQVNVMKNFIVVFFCCLTWVIVKSAADGGLNRGFLPVMIGGIGGTFGIIGFFLVRSLRKGEKT